MPQPPPEETAARRRRRARKIVETLAELYPEAECELEHADPYQLLVATILSAQTTDRAVNQVTPRLFARYPDAAALAAADPRDVEPLIASIGLYRNKARSIVGAARKIATDHDGRVPNDREALEALPGVGRKTASVVLSSAFGVPALAVDTHVLRLARRLGLSTAADPRGVERDLTALIPEPRWSFTSHALIWHGRRVCGARSPRCEVCALASLCPAAGAGRSARPVPGGSPRGRAGE